MQTTRTRQRIISLTSATATVCDNLFMFGTKTAPHWSYVPSNAQERLTPTEKARRLLQRLLSSPDGIASAQDSRNAAKG